MHVLRRHASPLSLYLYCGDLHPFLSSHCRPLEPHPSCSATLIPLASFAAGFSFGEPEPPHTAYVCCALGGRRRRDVSSVLYGTLAPFSRPTSSNPLHPSIHPSPVAFRVTTALLAHTTTTTTVQYKIDCSQKSSLDFGCIHHFITSGGTHGNGSAFA